VENSIVSNRFLERVVRDALSLDQHFRPKGELLARIAKRNVSGRKIQAELGRGPIGPRKPVKSSLEILAVLNWI
jgi:hypothetical protein